MNGYPLKVTLIRTKHKEKKERQDVAKDCTKTGLYDLWGWGWGCYITILQQSLLKILSQKLLLTMSNNSQKVLSNMAKSKGSVPQILETF